jgi:chaperone BCS1
MSGALILSNYVQGMGVALTMARQGMVLANATLQRRMLVSLEIRNSDPAYRWFLHWHAGHQRANAAALWARPHQLALETALERRRDGSAAAAFSMVAGPGTHYVRFRGAFMQVRITACAPAHTLLTPR